MFFVAVLKTFRVKYNTLSTHPRFLRRSRSRANLALRRKQHMIMSATSGKPRMHDTMGMMIFSGVTETNSPDPIRPDVCPAEPGSCLLTRRVDDYRGELFVRMIDGGRQTGVAAVARRHFATTGRAPRRRRHVLHEFLEHTDTPPPCV